jgi:hypothetical protein
MKSKTFLLIAASTFFYTAAYAAHVDMNDPRRALATDDDLRIDAQLSDDVIRSGSTVNVTFQIQNNSLRPVAVANKVIESSYDPESQTVTVSIGSEIPSGPAMPHLSVVKPGETRTFSTAAPVHIVMPAARSPFLSYPRYVQVKVIVLRDIAPFSDLIAQQRDAVQPPLPDALFETCIQNNDAIFLSAIPVHWKDGRSPTDQNGADVSMPVHLAGGMF